MEIIVMAKRGRKFTFHGAFATKAAAKRKERRVGGFILKRRMRGRGVRYLVVTKRKGR